MATNIKDNGLQINIRESVCTLGMMEDFMWENLMLIKGMDTECLYIKEVKYIWDIGRTIKVMG